jgi:Tfp pilus assembly protein PilF
MPRAQPSAVLDPPPSSGDQPAARLARAMAELKAQAILPLLRDALEALNAGRLADARTITAAVLKADPSCGVAWHVAALCHERDGDLNGALHAYERALQANPEDVDIANDLGRIAMLMGLYPVAETLFRRFVAERPGVVDGPNNLACALREQLRYGDALEVLRPAIQANPQSALLWNTLGATVAEQGDTETSLIFFDEALRLDPDFAKARHNRANIRLSLGDAEGALGDCGAALESPALTDAERAMMRFARSTMLLAAGRLEEGWDVYEARFDPRYVDVTHFAVKDERWTPGMALEGRDLLVFGEQGLGDEVLFANVLADVRAALGPGGRLTLAVERRLQPLFARSFPDVEVVAHATPRVEHLTMRLAPAVQGRRFDLWTPMGSLLRQFRRQVSDFPPRPAFLRADPARVSHWREALNSQPTVGLLWKSLKVASQRARFYAPFADWAPVLATPGVRFVNLQYGDCAAELAYAREALGVEIWSPPGVNLKDDLDEVAAIASALDVVLGPANATLNIAAACGTPTWFICPPGAWPMLGTEGYPWYPRARVFSPPGFNRWAPVMTEVASALRQDVSAAA